jgi:glucose-6-phosphate 1-dehydrogenase
LWNRNYIHHVEITSAEQEGIGLRGGYYDSSGALRDMLQNHLLQLVSLVAMEPAKSHRVSDVRTQKLKALQAIRVNFHNLILGQYEGYLEHAGVKTKSTTETFAALELSVNTSRWKGISFFVRTGKHLPKRMAQVYIQFKPTADMRNYPDAVPNYALFQIQPNEGLVIRMNVKVPGQKDRLQPVTMTFCHECMFGQHTPEAYENLLQDALQGDQSFFMHEKEIDQAWKIIDQIQHKKPPVVDYPKGTNGPINSEKMLGKNRFWWNDIEQVGQSLPL